MKMRILLLTIILTQVYLNCIGQIRSNKDLIGKWSAASLKLEFMPDGRLVFAMRGGSIPGTRYTTDFMRTPAVLHIELVQKTQKIVYKSSVEFIDNDSFRLTTLDNDPAHAFDKQRSVILRRDKD